MVDPKTIPAPDAALVLMMLEAVNVAGDAVKIANPFAVILPPILTAFADVFALVIVMTPRCVPPPTAPPNVMAPEVPPFNVKSVVPSSVVEKPIEPPVAAPLVVSNARGVAFKDTGPVIVMNPPLVVILPSIWRLLAAALKLARAVVPPRAAWKVVVPAPPTTESAEKPSTVSRKSIFALVEVMTLVDPVRLTGMLAGKLNGFVPFTVMLLAIWMRPPLVNVRFAKGAFPPTAPPRSIVPVPAVNDKL